MDKKKVYKVLFKGVILTGFEKDQVIDNVHKITRIPKETIARKFFSGKTVVIRHADSQEYASALQKTFSQAGIETYIEKVTQSEEDTLTSLTSEQSSSDTSGPTEENLENSQVFNIPESDKKSVKESFKTPAPPLSIQKKGAVAAIILLIVAAAGWYFSSDSTFQVQEQKQTEMNSVSKIPAKKTADTSTNKGASPSSANNQFLTPTSIEVLVKISDKSEVAQFLPFLALIDSDENFINLLQQAIKQNTSISKQTPIYLFKSSKHKGIYLPLGNKTDKQTIQQLKTHVSQAQGPLTNSTGLCSPKAHYSVVDNEDSLLITDSSQYKQKDDLSPDKNELLISLKSLEPVFVQPPNEDSASFNLYYQHPDSLNSKPVTLSLAAAKDKIWLFPNKLLQTSSAELLHYIGVDSNTGEVTSSKGKALYDLSRMILSQYYSQLSLNNTVEFKQEAIIPLAQNMATGELKSYQPQLDIELQAQWQSGPFAITTESYQFSDALVINLLAKGQNISNYMEYSQFAKMTPLAVLNRKNENILHNNCTDQLTSTSYFKDLNGVQEAFINDDFVAYREITSHNSVAVKPGSTIDDINTIEGIIELKIPKEIKFKSIEHPKKIHTNHLHHFFIITHLSDSKTLNYQIIGDKSHFITIRAYNKNGEILDSIDLKKIMYDSQNIYQFQQSFSQSVDSLKIYYSQKTNTKIYPFSLKPELTRATSLDTMTLTDEVPMVFDKTALQLTPLSSEVLENNPEWLGTKVNHTTQAPFHLSLFVHSKDNQSPEQKSNDLMDLVMNIKAPLTKLISQNLTAVKLGINDNNKSLFDEYVTFSQKEYFSEQQAESNSLPLYYLNSDSAFHYRGNNVHQINGRILLNLPTAFKTHTTVFQSSGQSIKLDQILIKPVKMSRQNIQFEISGKIDDLVQLRLFNLKNELISETLEFKQISANKALLTLIYTDTIDKIKLYLAQDSTQKEYPVKFTQN